MPISRGRLLNDQPVRATASPGLALFCCGSHPPDESRRHSSGLRLVDRSHWGKDRDDGVLGTRKAHRVLETLVRRVTSIAQNPLPDRALCSACHATPTASRNWMSWVAPRCLPRMTSSSGSDHSHPQHWHRANGFAPFR